MCGTVENSSTKSTVQPFASNGHSNPFGFFLGKINGETNIEMISEFWHIHFENELNNK